ncbi:site-specific integrase [Luteimonas aquatica]|uniref:site-specific integrase n=1 Tax=Luteimonas aquatica TaxID=450364 RepID=UPI001F56B0CC|nr:site-specific integrase [Luteimonas aquatica]
MRVAHYLVREPSGLFYFRLRVPLDLRPQVGRAIVKRATRARCPRQALAIATSWAAGYAAAFEALRGRHGMADKKLADELLEGIRQQGAIKYKVNLATGELEADGPEDHARALEAIEAIGRVPSAIRAEMAARPPACKPLDMDEAIRMWALTLPMDSPGKRKGSKSKRSKVEAFAAWKRARSGGPFLVSDATRTDFAEYFIACKASTTKRGKQPAPRYIENQFLVLALFFDWAMASNYFPKDDNPARGHAQVPKKERRRRAKSHGWQAFSAAQVGKIFNPEAYARLRTEAARWLPLLALYTGARANELAHLEIEDCYNYLGNVAVPVFDFNFLGDHKSLKTDASERITPVHPDLIALGLWERVERLCEAGETKLFPELEFLAENGPGNSAQSAFSRYLQRLKIKARGHGKVGMHSFRDTAITTMKLGGVREEYRREYCGHEQGETDDHHDAYGVDLRPPSLAKLCHPALSFGLDLPALRKLLV